MVGDREFLIHDSSRHLRDNFLLCPLIDRGCSWENGGGIFLLVKQRVRAFPCRLESGSLSHTRVSEVPRESQKQQELSTRTKISGEIANKNNATHPWGTNQSKEACFETESAKVPCRSIPKIPKHANDSNRPLEYNKQYSSISQRDEFHLAMLPVTARVKRRPTSPPGSAETRRAPSLLWHARL